MKKIISFVLAAVLLVSAVPTALATNDYSQGTQVVYEATGSESYTITVPAQLAPGGNGTVTLEGTWADNRIVSVTADPTVTLTNNIKAEDQKVLNVNFDGISQAGSNTTSQTFTQGISVDGITNALFGTWDGKFNYNIAVTTQLWSGNWTYGKTLANTNGLVIDYHGVVSEHIAIEPNQEYLLQTLFDDGEGIAKGFVIFYYDVNGNYISKSDMLATGKTNEVYTFVVPDNDRIATLRFSFKASYAEYASEAGLVPIKTNLFALKDLKDAGYKLAGKTLLNFGDSIAASADISYSYQIARKNYMSLQSGAIGGATIGTYQEKNIVKQIADSTTKNPDFILFNGYTNDASVDEITNKLGTISDGFDAELDTSTFCGSFETTIKSLKEKYPNAKLIYVTTHVNRARDAEIQETLANLAIEMCEKWDVTIADIYHDSGLDTFDNDMMATYIASGSHPNELGYKKFYVPIIEAKMKELVN